jgi:hypothetical protein
MQRYAEEAVEQAFVAWIYNRHFSGTGAMVQMHHLILNRHCTRRDPQIMEHPNAVRIGTGL